MTSPAPDALTLPVAAAALSWAALRLVVPHLQEPPLATQDETPGWTKPPYAGLGTATNQGLALGAGCLAGVVAARQDSPASIPLLLVLAGPVTALVLTDHRTTYLPLWLTRFCAVLTAAGAVAAALLSEHPTDTLVRIAAGALASGALFWLVWRLGAGLGFGDVRLAPMLGAGAVLPGWQAWWTAMLVGTALGALTGIATAAWRRRHPHPLGSIFPYGPSLWCGLWAGLLLT